MTAPVWVELAVQVGEPDGWGISEPVAVGEDEPDSAGESLYVAERVTTAVWDEEGAGVEVGERGAVMVDTAELVDAPDVVGAGVDEAVPLGVADGEGVDDGVMRERMLRPW